MHIYFSGIGGAGIGPLALIAHRAGFTVSGSDRQNSSYIEYLKKQGIADIHVGQECKDIAAVHTAQPIDWFVYTSALPMENPNAPELVFCREQGVKATKRDEFLTFLLEKKQLKLIAIAGTHGKTTTTAMTIWLFKQLGIPINYMLPAKVSFGEVSEYVDDAEYFVYEADEYDRNFLSFQPYISLITGIDWDHPDIYPTREIYNAAFKDFLEQSELAVLWDEDAARLDLETGDRHWILPSDNPAISDELHLHGLVNRQNAWLVANGLSAITKKPVKELLQHLNAFPGLGRRFEQVIPNLYSDYAHTPPKIRGALQTAHEIAGDDVVVVYEGLHNTRQHFIKDELKHLFDGVKQLYIVPSYLAREDPNLPILSPAELRDLLDDPVRGRTTAAELDPGLAKAIQEHLAAGDTVLCLSAGGGHSLDEWLRQTFHEG